MFKVVTVISINFPRKSLYVSAEQKAISVSTVQTSHMSQKKIKRKDQNT